MKTILLFILSFPAFGILPPVTSLISDSFEGRRGGYEVVLKHLLPGGLEIEEQLSYSAGKGIVSFKSNQGASSSAVILNGQYIFTDKKVPIKSFLFIKLLTNSSSDDFTEQLIRERFLSKDQLLFFQPPFELLKDPASWMVQDNYLKQENVYLKRSRGIPMVAVTGYKEGNQERIVYFDPKGQGIRRLEWRELEERLAWNFDSFQKIPKLGLFPKRISLERGGTEVFHTEVSHLAFLKKDFAKLNVKNASPSAGPMEESIRLILSNR